MLRPKRKRKGINNAIRRILMRANRCSGRFAVFVLPGALIMVKPDGGRFRSLNKRWPDRIAGIYDRQLSVISLIDDLSPWFEVS